MDFVLAEKNIIISILIFLLLLGGFSMAVSTVSADTQSRQKENLEYAIERGITQCYVVEGKYPQSISYLTEHYGISYDTERFLVDYEIFGSNLRPQVQVMEVQP